MLKQGCSAKAVVAKLHMAIEGHYHAKGFDKYDYQKTFLPVKLGSRKLLHGLNNAGDHANRSSLHAQVPQMNICCSLPTLIPNGPSRSSL